MLLVSDLNFDPIAELLGKFGLVLELLAEIDEETARRIRADLSKAFSDLNAV